MKKTILKISVLILIFSNQILAQQKDLWTTFTTTDGLAGNYVQTILESSDGALWFGTNDGGVSHFQECRWTTFNTNNSGLVSNKVRIILESNEGALWFGTEYGVSRFQNGVWTNFDHNSVPGSAYVNVIIESNDGALWFGTYNFLYYGCVSRYQQGSWTNFTSADGFASNVISDILEASDGALWFGTWYGGVIRYQQGIWTTFTTADGLASNSVRDILEASDGTLWFGTDNGVSKLSPDKISPFSFIIEGPKDNCLIGNSPAFYINGYDYRTQQNKLRFLWEINKDQSLLFRDSLNIDDSKLIQTNINQNGTFRFKVRAKDLWGNIDQTPATRTFRLDLTQPTTTIKFPRDEDIMSDMVIIQGSVYDNSPIQDFEYYSISYGAGKTAEEVQEWKTIADSIKKEVRDHTLAYWNTASDSLQGTYQLKLFAKDALGHESEDIITVHIVDAIQEVQKQQGGYVRAE